MARLVMAGLVLFFWRKNNRIGGMTPAARNLISGNIGDGVSLGRIDSTNRSRQLHWHRCHRQCGLGNTQRGVTSNGGNLIGGNTAAARNVISGNNRGIELGAL